MTPPMFDSSNIVIWKTKMSIYLQTLGLHVFLAATKKCYLGNSNHIGANAQAVGPKAHHSSFDDDQLMKL